MTNQKWFRSFELSDMLEAMNRNLRNEDCGCILEVITGEYAECPKGSCRECIGKWLKAEKESSE